MYLIYSTTAHNTGSPSAAHQAEANKIKRCKQFQSSRTSLLITGIFYLQFPTALAFTSLIIIFAVRTGEATFRTLGFHTSAS